jgi:hypothetical protein
MALSDQLTELAARAKQAEDRAAAARDKSTADVQADVETARASAQERAKKLRESAEANKNKLSVWWYDLQHTWNEHVAKIRDDIDSKRAEHDVDRAERRASTERTTRSSPLTSRTRRSRRRSTQSSTPNWRGRRRTSCRRPDHGLDGRAGRTQVPRVIRFDLSGTGCQARRSRL